MRVEEELKENGNGTPEFRLDLGTAFLVVEKVSRRAMEIEFNKAGSKDGTIEGVENQDGKSIVAQIGTIDGTIEFPTLLHKNVYNLLSLHPQINRVTISDNLGVSLRSVARIIADLRSLNLISRKGGARHGEWVVTKIR